MLLTPASPAASPEVQLSSDLSGYSRHQWPGRQREGGLHDDAWACSSPVRLLISKSAQQARREVLKLCKLCKQIA